LLFHVFIINYQVLNQNCGPMWRYASLLRACSSRPVSLADQAALDRHGMRAAALTSNPPLWMMKYAADNLRFVEFERKALPCALMRPKNGRPSFYAYATADMDARSVMEQRLQALVCCFSMVDQVLSRQPQLQSPDQLSPTLSQSSSTGNTELAGSALTGVAIHQTGTTKRSDSLPLRTVPPIEAAGKVWKMLQTIPDLIEEHMLAKLNQAAATAANAVASQAQLQLQLQEVDDAHIKESAEHTDGLKLENCNAQSTNGQAVNGINSIDGTNGSMIQSTEGVSSQAVTVHKDGKEKEKEKDMVVVKKASVKKLNAALAELRELFAAPTPKGPASLRSSCLAVRKVSSRPHSFQ
jgi:hypothetical protein